jgi:hypothetical protein
MPESLEHPPDLASSALMDAEADFVPVGKGHVGGFIGGSRAILQFNALPKLIELVRLHGPFRADAIKFVDFVGRVH